MSNISEDFEDGDVELKDGYLEYQGMLELQELQKKEEENKNKVQDQK